MCCRALLLTQSQSLLVLGEILFFKCNIIVITLLLEYINKDVFTSDFFIICLFYFLITKEIKTRLMDCKIPGFIFIEYGRNKIGNGNLYSPDYRGKPQ